MDGSKPLKIHKQEVFVHEYLIDHNQTQAAIRAGYSKTGANGTASRMLSKAHVRARVDFLSEKHLSHLHITKERILKELARIAFADPQNMFDENDKLLSINDMPEDARKVIAGIEVVSGPKDSIITKLKICNKTTAIDQLMKHLGGYKEHQEQIGQTIADIMAQVQDTSNV